jgi:MYXO-CTERM domain-containing protein
MISMRMSVAALVGAVGLAAGIAEAGPVYGFTRITNNGSQDVASQLTVEVEAAGANQVDFIFRNSGPLASSITDIYFDDGSLLGIASIINGGAGVDFSQGASPGALPGGSAVNFNTSAGFSADSNSPAQPMGVNPGEMVTIRFDLIGGQDINDTLAAMALSLANPGADVLGGLRIGIHVQGLPDGQSDGFVNGGGAGGGGPMIPLPSAGAMGLAGLGLIARRQRRLA